MAKLTFPPRKVTVVPDPRWPWNPAFDLLVEMKTKEQTVTDDGLDLLVEFETTGVTRRRVGWRESWGYWDSQIAYWWNRLDRWSRR